jgi:hypothetical protein
MVDVSLCLRSVCCCVCMLLTSKQERGEYEREAGDEVQEVRVRVDAAR